MTPIVTAAQSTARGSLEVNVSLFPSEGGSKDKEEGEDESAATITADVSSSSKSDTEVLFKLPKEFICETVGDIGSKDIASRRLPSHAVRHLPIFLLAQARVLRDALAERKSKIKSHLLLVGAKISQPARRAETCPILLTSWIAYGPRLMTSQAPSRASLHGSLPAFNLIRKCA